ncbi:MAG: hypothetical protein ACK4PI_12005 [Tepidisphaerales bacterium]
MAAALVRATLVRPALVGAALAALGMAGCQAVEPIPPAPVATPIRPVDPAGAAGEASGRPQQSSSAVPPAVAGVNDPAALEARIRQLVAELEAAREASARHAGERPAAERAGGERETGEASGMAARPPAARFEPQAAEAPAVLAAARDEPGTPPPVAASPGSVRIEVGGPSAGQAVPAASGAGASEAGSSLPTNQAVSVESRGAVPAVSVADGAVVPAAAGGPGGVATGFGGVAGGVEAMVARRVERDPRDVSAQLDAALLAYLREEPTPNASAIASLPQEDREIIAAAIDALVNFRAGVRSDPNMMYAARVRPFAEMSDRLRLRSELAVPVVAMASRVDSFGVYEPMPQVISPRSETVTVLYTEVANFTSRLTETRQWETRLSAELGLFDASGRRVWSFRPPLKVDLCRNRRTDFFISYLVRIPPQPPGRYVLKVTVTDENVGRVAEGLLPLESKESR